MVRGARTYHLEFSRNRMSGSKVKEPRHFLLYRRRHDGVDPDRAEFTSHRYTRSRGDVNYSLN